MYAVDPPGATVWLVGDGLSAKLNEMTSESDVECVRPPLVPTMVTVYVPTCAMTLVVKVIVVVAFAGFGVNDTLTPDGRPVAEKLTGPVKPPDGVTVTADCPEAPRSILRLVGEALRAKSAGVAEPWTTS